MATGAQGDSARSQEDHRVIVLDDNRSTGAQYLMTTGAQVSIERSQEEHRVIVLADNSITG
jgi:hypothetical protein